MSRTFLATLLAMIAAGTQAQMPPMNMKMPQAGPPQPGDEALSCDQIAQEMAGILKQSGVGKNREQNLRDACTLRGEHKVDAADQAKAQAGVMANANSTMAAFSNPRVMRLGLLAQQKNCAANAPTPAKTAPKDPCDDIQPDKSRPISRTARPPAPPAPSVGAGADPFVQSGAASPSAPPDKPPK